MDSPKDITQTFDPKDLRKYKGKWGSKKQLDIVKQVRSRFHKMAIHRSTSCYWPTPPTTKDSFSSPRTTVQRGGDWMDHVNYAWKLFSMYSEYVEGRSNLKSPISFSPVMAIMAEFQNQNIGLTLTGRPQDAGKLKGYSHIIEHVEKTGNFAQAKATSLMEMMVAGTAITHNTHLKKMRKDVEVIVSGDRAREMIDNADAAGTDQLEEILRDKPLTETKDIVDYDDVSMTPVAFEEFYVDDAARSLHGLWYEASDCVWRSTPSLEQLRALFLNSSDPYVMKENVDKVRTAKDAASVYSQVGEQPLFVVPADIETGSDRVELIHYYNKNTFKYYVVANDVLLRDGPLPFAHGKLPFSRHVLVDIPNQFYGLGFPVLLQGLQSEDETLRNMAIEQLKILLSPPIFINTDVFEQIDSQWSRIEAGLKVEVNGSVGPENIRMFDSGVSRLGEVQALRQELRQDGVFITGVNPIAYSMPQAGEAVRNNIMGMESTQRMVRRVITNWGEGYKESWKQMIKIIQQVYPDSYIVESTGLDKDGDVVSGVTIAEKRKYKTIPIQGFELRKTEDGDLEETRINGSSEFELTPDMIELSDDPQIEFNVDSLAATSKSVQIEAVQTGMAQLIPIFANPQLLQNPAVQIMVRDYIDLLSLNPKLKELLNDAGSEDDTEEAMQQNARMEAGIPEPGVPGRSQQHLLIHALRILELLQMRDMPGLATTVQEIQQIEAVLNLYRQHIAIDNMPRADAAMAAGTLGQQQPQQQMPQVPMPPQGGAGQQMMPGMGVAPMGGSGM